MAEIQAIRYDWHTYSCYIGVMRFKDVPNYINSNIDQSMNRLIDPKRVSEIIEYISTNLSNAFFPPVILNSSNKIEYNSQNETLSLKRKDLVIIDGQHRIKAINDINESQDINLKNNIANLNLPFLLIESLDPMDS